MPCSLGKVSPAVYTLYSSSSAPATLMETTAWYMLGQWTVDPLGRWSVLIFESSTHEWEGARIKSAQGTAAVSPHVVRALR